MKLRTIKFWALYSPSHRHIVVSKRFKKDLPPRQPGEVVVQFKGFYVPSSEDK